MDLLGRSALMSGHSGARGKGPGPLKIQWGPWEILPEGPMDPQNWRIGNEFQWRDPSNFAWGPLKFKLWGPGPSTKNVYREP